MYQVTRKRHQRYEGGEITTFEVGDVIEPTDEELAAFGDRFEPLNESGSEPSDGSSDEPDAVSSTEEDQSPSDSQKPADAQSDASDGNAPFDPAEYSVSELEDRLEAREYSKDELTALINAEESGKNRSTALGVLGGG